MQQQKIDAVRAVAERLGFRHEGIHREVYLLDGRFVDIEVYSLLADEWEAREEMAFSLPLTDDTELRLLLPHYAEAIYAEVDRNRERLRPYMTWIDGTTSVEQISGFIRGALASLGEGTGTQWGIWSRGCCAGCIGTASLNRANKKAEFGYWIGKEYEGQGLVTAAGRAMLRYFVRDTGVATRGTALTHYQHSQPWCRATTGLHQGRHPTPWQFYQWCAGGYRVICTVT